METATSTIEVLGFIKDIFVFFKDQVHAYRHVGQAASDLETKIRLFEKTLEHTMRYEDLAIFDYLQNIIKTLASSKQDIEAFLAMEEENTTATTTTTTTATTTTAASTTTTTIKSRIWRFFNNYPVKRAFLASGLEKLFNETASRIDNEIILLNTFLQVTDRLSKVGAYRFRDCMTPEAFDFWKYVCQDDLTVLSHRWPHFISLYRLYGTDRQTSWDTGTLARIKTIACEDGDDVTIGGYILLTRQCGFPLDPTKLPPNLDASLSLPTQTQSKIAKSIKKLTLHFSKDTLCRHIMTIRRWYAKCPIDPQHRQKRANQWAHAFLGLKTKSESSWDAHDKLVDKVDLARRTLFYFYHQHSVMFEIGQFNKELFKKQDYQGRKRMRDFINLVKPLDKANYGTILGKNAHAWDKDESNSREVYQFVESYLASLEAKTTPKNTYNATISAISTMHHLPATTSSSSGTLMSTSHQHHPTTTYRSIGHGRIESPNRQSSYLLRISEVDLLQIRSSGQDAADPF